MENDSKIVLSVLKNFEGIQERDLISMMYYAKRNGLDTSADFFVDIFGLNSEKIRGILREMEEQRLITISSSTTYDPDLLVPKYKEYSLNGYKPDDEFIERVNKTIKPIKDLDFEDMQCLSLISYLIDSVNDPKKAVSTGLKIGINPEKIERGLQVSKSIKD